MKILVLTHYYPPDLSAGSFRAHALARALSTVDPSASIEVLTAQPSRYGSFVAQASELEVQGSVRVRRIPVPRHSGSTLGQIKTFLAFARGALRHTANDRYDIVVATSSRLMTAVLGSLVSRRTASPLYLDIRDIFVDTIAEIGNPLIRFTSIPAFGALERWAFDRAEKINLVSEGFAGYFGERYPNKPLAFFTNGIDDEFLGRISTNSQEPTSPITVLYAGNIGEGQGLENIVPALARRLGERVRFRIIGDGGRRQALADAVAELDNVRIEAPMARDRLKEAYDSADVLFLHLNDHQAFRKVLPSKLFEYAATGKPIWAGLAGFSAEFLEREVENIGLFPPCDADAGLRTFETIDLHFTPRAEFCEAYSRRKVSLELARDILGVVAHSEP